MVWKYHDSLREYVKAAGSAREKVNGLLRTVQQTSETLLAQAKEQVSARLESARGKVRTGASEAGRGRPTEFLCAASATTGALAPASFVRLVQLSCTPTPDA